MSDSRPSEVRVALGRATAALAGGGEARPGQVEMAEAVARAATKRRHLIVQAGTGTGKSLAYLVPLIELGLKVVVSTATKALQDQLAGKDLPFLAAVLETPVDFAVLKGRSNYLCRQKLIETGSAEAPALDVDATDAAVDPGGREPGPDGPELDRAGSASDPARHGEVGGEILRIIDWARTTPTGDRSELDFEPRPSVWSQMSVSAMECPGAARCPSGEVCFAERARQQAEEAGVVVVNTHLYGAHLATGGHILPDHDLVVFDEAHELEDIAASSLGLELSPGRLRALARMAGGVVADRKLLDDVQGAADLFEDALRPLRGRRLRNPGDERLASALTVASERISRLLSSIRSAPSLPGTGSTGNDPRRARVQQAGGHLGGDLALARAIPATDVAWVDGPDHAPVLKIAPVDVGEKLAEVLFASTPAVLTSATIPPLLAERLGLAPEDVDVVDVGSPFDYREQALLYCAAHLPDPRKPAYEAAMHAELEALIRLAGGRTLALFTSWRAMRAAADSLRDELPYAVLTQADLPKPALLRQFTDDETSCLFATMGFWQGVDVPGGALSLVTIDRIPFPRPDEPLLEARRELAGARAFHAIDLPRAATLLAQGAGRLIRTATDRGVVAVLDPRLASASYRWELVNAMPPMRRTRNLSDVSRFFSGLATT